jgi:secreted PhoX family phosphatase
MAANLNRREFHSRTGAAFAGLLASGCVSGPGRLAHLPAGYGPLVADPAGLIDLPPGFTYRIISSLGEPMHDGEPVPDRADGMGAFRGRGGRVILVRNHELKAGESSLGGAAFDRWKSGGALPGGTTTLVYNPASGRVEQQYRSLAGTIRNCAGGVTPWRTWLTCEEDMTVAGGSVGKSHGWVFEVPADLRGRAQAVPLTGLGRFNHEAAAVDPRTGIVYLTEDRDNSLFYRFIPAKPGRLREPGRLQALALADGRLDSRNWGTVDFALQRPSQARWIDLDGVDSVHDDLRQRGAALGACLFARGEGIHMEGGELYFTCTNGGAAKLGQVMRFRPAANGGQLDLFFESTAPEQFSYGDNLTVGPNGHLYVCEDQPGDTVDNYIRGIRPDGAPYAFARLRLQTELAGACFSPDGRTMFVNAYSPTRTIAISGRFA